MPPDVVYGFQITESARILIKGLARIATLNVLKHVILKECKFKEWYNIIFDNKPCFCLDENDYIDYLFVFRVVFITD